VEFLQELQRIAVAIDAPPLENQVLGLARQHRLTVYDAAYLELAMREALPLATLDTALADAARAEGVPLIGEVPTSERG
jgi:predicted nucleic acid-binding protein